MHFAFHNYGTERGLPPREHVAWARARSSECLVTWWRGVLTQGNLPRHQIGVAQEVAHQRGRAADAGPVVIPQRGHQPRTIGGEHQVGQGTLPERPRSAPAPRGRLLWPSLYE